MGLKYLFECEDCHARFTIGEGGADLHCNVPYVTTEYRWSIFLTYYDCPKCGRRHYVQIDDTRSLELKQKASSMFVKLSKKRLDFKDIPKEHNEEFKKLNRRLENYRLKLKERFNGQVFIGQDNSKVEVHFSV